ncbi:ADP-ribosylation factor-like protein 2-binding protein isoform X1 [Lepeophtheirus salmonis]|uniref:ADP-ribosylation factor-like protein 2-binding protein isoform X1 n=1 Tax=Lepeophtheirus salmonis TaxID=72036 RepID=UPI001AE17ED8|nr:ADP-ribosylation factor-like protein 2-binding protein isoform X1 [Lepeophtheirus salmonis]
MSNEDIMKSDSKRNNFHSEDDGVILVQSEISEPSNFDKIVGCIEDIVIEDEFQELQQTLLDKHYIHFDENLEENKFIYTEIFEEYTSRVETFIETELSKRIPEFNMKYFIQEFEERKSSLEGEVFDMLFTLTDFMAFKEMFIDYKIVRETGLSASLSTLAL